MWRVKRPHSEEHGAVAVVVAVLMVVFLGFAAISIDVARLFSERAQLQNGADAATLMVAQKCAKDPNDDNCSSTPSLAATLADANSLDGQSLVRAVELKKATPATAGTVEVTTSAKEEGVSANRVSNSFAGVLGFPTTEVNAVSAAEWGSPKAGRTAFPMAISVCQVNSMLGKPDPQLLQNHGQNKNPDCPHDSTSGAVIPGGFAWLTSDPGACGATVDLSVKEAASDPGNNAPLQCKAELERWISNITAKKDDVIYLPVYDKVEAGGSNAIYNLVSFAAFQIEGWKFTGDDKKVDPIPFTFRNDMSPSTSCIDSCRGIIGRFVEYVSLGEGFTLGPITNGAVVVRLTH